MNNFKAAFFRLLACPVINVRVLAAKAFAAFTNESDASKELEAILERLQRAKSANFANGLLHAAFLLADSKVGVSSEKLKVVQEHFDKYFAQCYENKVLIHKILLKLKVGLEIKPLDNKDYHHPGFARWIKLTNCDANVKDATSTNVSDFSDKTPGELVSFLSDHLEDNEEVDLQMVGKCLERISDAVGAEKVLEDAEAALDLLDLATDDRLASTNDFSSTSSSSLRATALAFASMLVQPDWDMFFGKDESPYVSRFVEFTERLARHSTPYPGPDGGSADEDCRYSAAMALQALLPMFRKHRVKDMPAVMR